MTLVWYTVEMKHHTALGALYRYEYISVSGGGLCNLFDRQWKLRFLVPSLSFRRFFFWQASLDTTERIINHKT